MHVATPRPRERFENANIFISPTFKETVGNHLKPSLPVVVMDSMNSIERGLINLCRWSMGKLNKLNLNLNR